MAYKGAGIARTVTKVGSELVLSVTYKGAGTVRTTKTKVVTRDAPTISRMHVIVCLIGCLLCSSDSKIYRRDPKHS